MNGSPGRGLIAAAALFTVALFVFGTTLVRALDPAPGIQAAPTPGSRPEPAVPATSNEDGSLTMDALLLAVDNDPFTPERTRSGERYRLPGDVDPEPPPAPPEPPPVPQFRLSGTVVTSEGGLALIQVGEDAPRMLTVGEFMQGYRLTNVTAAGATMANDERELQLRVPSPSRVAQAPAAPQRGANARGRPSVDPRQLQQLVERARASGATPQMLESLMRMVQERGLTNIDQMEVGPNGFSFRSGNTDVRSATRVRVVPDTMELRMPRAPELR